MSLSDPTLIEQGGDADSIEERIHLPVGVTVGLHLGVNLIGST
jgi:hypothetical protein